EHSLGKIWAWPRPAMCGLHGSRRLRAVGCVGSKSETGRQLEATEVATIMTTLVTGATGFIGWHVTRLLTTRVDRVRVLFRPTSQLKAIEDLPVERVYGDLRDASSLRTALAGVTQVFHVAADYRLWARDPQEIYDSNVAGTRNLIEASKDAGVQRFVY